MTISNALSAALTGLTASSRAASVVSENIANARTEGFGERNLTLSSIAHGAGRGVQVVGVTRSSDPVILGERRSAGAAQGEAETRAGYLQRIETLIGLPGEGASVSARFDAFETSLVSAASRPDSQARLDSVLNAAQQLAGTLNNISDGIQEIRQQADALIATEITHLNRTLSAIHDLNGTIRTSISRGENALGLIDRQQALIDGIADLVPIRETRNDAGMVSLYTTDGLPLVEGRPAEFGFSATPAITPLMSLQNNDLSGLTVNGRPINTSGSYASLSGGRLAALFAVRDEIAPQAQAQLDGLALDLTARLDNPGLDPTRAAADPGLFSDDGLLASATYEDGLAARITVNAAVDPDRGGALWRLRDGVGATSEGAPGDPTLLQGILDALQTERPTASTAFSATSRSMAELASDVLSLTSMDRQFADARAAETSGKFTALREAELSRGVDTDQQMQRLLEIENAYAANARVISTLDDMLDRLLGL
jgi:flagellar hook-associated protein 1 FlgK